MIWNYLLAFWAFQCGVMAVYAAFWAINYYKTKQPTKK
jgi:hypothetical protein